VRTLALHKQVLLGFGLAVLVLLAVTGSSWFVTQRFMQTSNEAVHSADTVVPLERSLSQMYGVEAAQRGYFFVGAPAFLVQREAAVRGWQQALDELRRLQASTAPPPARIDALSQLAQARQRRLDELLAIHTQQPARARELLIEGYGHEEMDAFAAAVHREADQAQAQALRQGEAAAKQANHVLLAFGLAAASAVVVLGYILRLILRGLDERQRAHEALADSQARLNAIVDTTLDGLVVIDESGLIQRFNQSAERLFGYTEAEVLGRNVSLLMPSPDREAHDAHLQRYRSTGQRHIIGIGREVMALRRNGERFPVELAVGEARVQGHALFTGLIRDITDRKRAQERQAQLLRELQAANEELGNFAYVTSHDLKAPLRAIGSLAQWLATDYADRFDEEGRSHMALLLSRVKRMDRLIDGVLQYSRLGRAKETTAEVDLDALVHETVDLLAPPPHIAVHVERLPTLRTERTRAQQLFQNLIGNAIQAMDKPRGEIRVSCADDVQGMWHFQVTDNGPGIERRHWDRVFQLFQSLKPRDATESTGIGLSVVKKIVEMYGGRVWIDSEMGSGTTFHFTLPKEAACT
jgi:PAS domain S-box-containing protein